MGRNLTYAQRIIIERKNQEKVLRACPGIPDAPGIYIFTRSEGAFKYAYVGQARRLLVRVAQHFSGYQHIDLSIKKHGLYSEDNPAGYRITFMRFPIEQLDEQEQFYIQSYANAGYQLRNATAGGQGEGKHSLGNQRAPRGYRDGLNQGYKNAQKEVAHLFDKHLVFAQKSPKPNKIQAKAVEKFRNFLAVEESESNVEEV